MAPSKNLFLLLGVLLLVVNFSDVAHADEKSTKTTVVGAESLRRCPHGCCKWAPGHRGCIKCCKGAEETADAQSVDNVEKNDVATDAGCRHGCCKWIPHKGCKKCCPSLEEAIGMDAGCPHGCCKWIPHKGCKKCCRTAEEATEAEVEN